MFCCSPRPYILRLDRLTITTAMSATATRELIPTLDTDGKQRICDRCNKPIFREKDGFTTGYGTNQQGEINCFACCGEIDMISLQTGTTWFGYVNTDTGMISNWPGTLNIKARYIKRGRHNIARTRYDVWFSVQNPDGTRSEWHGVNLGDMEVLRCKRVKTK